MVRVSAGKAKETIMSCVEGALMLGPIFLPSANPLLVVVPSMLKNLRTCLQGIVPTSTDMRQRRKE